MRINLLFGIICISFITGCTTLTKEAESVIVHSQVSNLLDDCERLGNLIAKSETNSNWSRGLTLEQAKNNVRDKAYHKYNADTVAIINSDNLREYSSVQAIAFKCN